MKEFNEQIPHEKDEKQWKKVVTIPRIIKKKSRNVYEGSAGQIC
jgi:hypothetical protein